MNIDENTSSIKMDLDENLLLNHIPGLSGFDSPTLDPFDLFRRRGSSNVSWRSNRSFNFGAVTPINIPNAAFPSLPGNNNNNNTLNTVNESIKNDPSSLSSTSTMLDTQNYNTNDFVRSAPVNGGVGINGPYNNNTSWDQAITNTMPIEVDQDQTTQQKQSDEVPDFMKSNFFIPDTVPPFSRNTSIESMTSLIDPNQPAPQSAPPTNQVDFGPWDYQEEEIMALSQINPMNNNNTTPMEIFPPAPIFGNIFPNSLNEPALPPSIITEDDIFGTNNRNRNLSTITTESENEPILKNMMNKKRNRTRSMSDGHPLNKKLRRNTNDHNGIPPMINIKNEHSITPTIVDGVNKYSISRPVKRGRGRPRKHFNTTTRPKKQKKMSSKYDGCSKAEREKLRRKELKEGYTALTEMLGLATRKGATLPDRSVIIASACDEIKRLENKLFQISMKN